MMIRREPDDPRLTPVHRRKALIAEGWNDRALAAAVRSGQLVKPRRGTYADAGAWAEMDENGRHEVVCRAAILTAGTGVAISHLSSMAIYETPTWGLTRTAVDLTRLDGRAGRSEAGVRQHRGELLEGDVVEVAGVSVIHPTRAALEVTTQLGVEAAVVQLCDLLHRGLTTPERLAERYARHIDRWPGSRATDLCLRLARREIESVGEARVLYLLHRYGVPMPTLQRDVHDLLGRRLGRVDFAWPEYGVFLEFDGKVKYEKLLRPGESASDVVVREKRRESDIVRATGWRCIRLTWADLLRPERTARMILDLLRAAA